MILFNSLSLKGMKAQSSLQAETIMNSSGLREILHKELDLIESAINRMAHNSFLVKGWMLSIFAFVFALRPDFSMSKLTLVMIAPILSFWWLDSFYLRLERAFRDMYKDRCVKRTAKNDWTGLYDMDIKSHLANQQSILRIMRSPSTFPFYFVLFLMTFCLWLSAIKWGTLIKLLRHLCFLMLHVLQQ